MLTDQPPTTSFLGAALPPVPHKLVIDNYIQNELSAHRVAGPFSVDECCFVNINCFGVIPKHHQANKWRLIVDLSHHEGFSINDGIPSHLCSLSYITVDDAIQEILQTGPGTLLAKVDIKMLSAYSPCILLTDVY